MSALIRGCNSSRSDPRYCWGDLSTDAFNRELSDDFRRRLNFPRDLWLTSGDGSVGVTIDRRRSFHSTGPRLAVHDPERYRHGSRVDYLLSWPGLWYVPQYRNTPVLHLQSRMLRCTDWGGIYPTTTGYPPR